MDGCSFHDQLADDLLEVFFNPDEFGKICTWDGQQIPYSEPPIQEIGAGFGTNEEILVIHCRIRDFPRAPGSREKVVIDGITWLTGEVKTAIEFYVISLRRAKS